MNNKQILEIAANYKGDVSIEEYLAQYGLEPDNAVIAHEGTAHEGDIPHSGRYVYGSGENPYQRNYDIVARSYQLEKEGLSSGEITDILGKEFKMKIGARQLRAYKGLVKDHKQRTQPRVMVEMYKNGMSYRDIATEFGVVPSTVRNKVVAYNKINVEHRDVEENSKKLKAFDLAENLRKVVDEKNIVDVGRGVEAQLGVSTERLQKAIEILKAEGYHEYSDIKIEQITNPKQKTSYKLLAAPDVQYSDVYKPGAIQSLKDYTSRDGGKTFEPSYRYPSSLDEKRVGVRYKEEGGALRDGMIEIRPGCKDLSLGTDQYAQVRILVNGTHYIKGVGVYATDTSDWPKGVDVMVNSNKTHDKAPNKLDALKSIDKNIKKDPTNPFGSAIKENGGQSYYDDPNGDHINPVTGRKESLSYINKRAGEGDWSEWKDTLAAQFLSKQPISLVNRQLEESMKQKREEYDEIMSLTNPTIRKHMLESFADGCDTTALSLKAAPLPNQKFNVILPINSLPDTEIYAPRYENGTQLALVRYPHAGTFEIPILTVNNNNKEGKGFLGNQPTDAVGINSNIAERLSGADFDGDTVMCIPITEEINVRNSEPLKGLVGFDTKDAYQYDEPPYEDENGETHYKRKGKEYTCMTKAQTQTQMGVVSNLITDMTLQDATLDEMARAVRHSMVVIDAEKHHLDWKSSEKENGIAELKQKYQTHIDPITGKVKQGASTLISMAKNESVIPERKEGAIYSRDTNKELRVVDEAKEIYEDPDTGEIYSKSRVHPVYYDPVTGAKLYRNTNRIQYQYKYKDNNGKTQTANAWLDKDGKIAYYKLGADGKKSDKTLGVFKAEVDDANVIKKTAEIKESKMNIVDDARVLISPRKTKTEIAYANYANFMKAMANQARKEYMSTTEIKQNKEAAEKYKEQVDSLMTKYNASLLNAPKERTAQILARNELLTMKKAAEEAGEEWDKETDKKKRTRALRAAREMVGAKRNPVVITEKEYEAIQAGAFAKDKLNQIIRAMDDETLKQIATPKDSKKIPTAQVARAKAQLKNGHTLAEVARNLGVSVSVLQKNLKEE